MKGGGWVRGGDGWKEEGMSDQEVVDDDSQEGEHGKEDDSEHLEDGSQLVLPGVLHDVLHFLKRTTTPHPR